MRPAIGSVLRASIAALSAALFPQMPVCPGTHIKIVSFLSALILCTSSCICISRGWSVLKFLGACRAEGESKKIMIFFFFWLVYLFKNEQNCLQFCCINRMVSQSTREGAIWSNRWYCCSSNLLVYLWAIGIYLHIFWMSGCYFYKGFVESFLYFVKDRQIWGSDWPQGRVSVTVVSSATSRLILQSSVVEFGGQEVVKLDFWKFWVWWFKNTAVSWVLRTSF